MLLKGSVGANSARGEWLGNFQEETYMCWFKRKQGSDNAGELARLATTEAEVMRQWFTSHGMLIAMQRVAAEVGLDARLTEMGATTLAIGAAVEVLVEDYGQSDVSAAAKVDGMLQNFDVRLSARSQVGTQEAGNHLNPHILRASNLMRYYSEGAIWTVVMTVMERAENEFGMSGGDKVRLAIKAAAMMLVQEYGLTYESAKAKIEEVGLSSEKPSATAFAGTGRVPVGFTEDARPLFETVSASAIKTRPVRQDDPPDVDRGGSGVPNASLAGVKHGLMGAVALDAANYAYRYEVSRRTPLEAMAHDVANDAYQYWRAGSMKVVIEMVQASLRIGHGFEAEAARRVAISATVATLRSEFGLSEDLAQVKVDEILKDEDTPGAAALVIVEAALENDTPEFGEYTLQQSDGAELIIGGYLVGASMMIVAQMIVERLEFKYGLPKEQAVQCAHIAIASTIGFEFGFSNEQAQIKVEAALNSEHTAEEAGAIMTYSARLFELANPKVAKEVMGFAFEEEDIERWAADDAVMQALRSLIDELFETTREREGRPD